MEITPARHGVIREEYAEDLEQDLRERVEGEVRFTDAGRALYATDASPYRLVPIGVVIPKSVDDIIAAMAVCRRYGAPVFSRGAGTSLAGQCCNTGVVFDFSKYLNRLVELDPLERTARVEPGIVLDALNAQTAKWGLAFGPDPVSRDRCTIGGMVGNNAYGVHGAATIDHLEELEILTYDGIRMTVGATGDEEFQRNTAEGGRRAGIYHKLRGIADRYGELVRQRYPKIPLRGSGYPLDQLLSENGFHIARALAGSESTCVTVLEAKVRLAFEPQARALLTVEYADVHAAAAGVPLILMERPAAVHGLEMPNGRARLLVEFAGEDRSVCDDRVRALMTRLNGAAAAVNDSPGREAMWPLREGSGWHDWAVAPEKLATFVRDLKLLHAKFGVQSALHGPFGQGCVHSRVQFDAASEAGRRRYRRYMEEATDLVIKHGGAYSAGFGDGQSTAEFLPKLYGEELMQAFREFKRVWDPDGKMNPGKLVDANRVDSDLRLAAGAPSTHEMARCTGSAECRRQDGGTMCPSYRVTLEEQHSTRGRARLLDEMMRGELIRDGWKSDAVRGALDLCLGCKACKSECPESVDIAKYKAEFLARHYDGQIRPFAAYGMGMVERWARLGSLAPWIANAMSRSPGFRDAVKLMGGVAWQRQIPRLAHRTFRRWIASKAKADPSRPAVILWADTFNNYFTPSVAIAAVEVLEDAGFRVLVSKAPLCCGRPLIEYGMLDAARLRLRETLDTLRRPVRKATPVVVLEPGCASVFRDDMADLINDADAGRLRDQTFTLAEFLERYAPNYALPRLKRRLAVHGHCHQKAVMTMDADQRVLDRSGADYRILDSGCCGMAGGFGFEREHYDISQQIGERELYGRLRALSRDTLILADGFSCREQIRQALGLETLHLAEALSLAIHEQRGDRLLRPAAQSDPRLVFATGAAGLMIGGGLLWGMQHRRTRRKQG